MKPLKQRWAVWVVWSLACFVAAVFPLCGFWAAADLGYDNSPHGKEIMEWWCGAMLALVAAGIGCAVFAITSWWSNRKPGKGPAERDS